MYDIYIYINKYLRGVTNQLRTGGAPHCGNIFDDPPAISKLSLWLSGEISRDQNFEKKKDSRVSCFSATAMFASTGLFASELTISEMC